MSKVRQGNFFEDFAIGMTFTHAAPRTLTEGDRSLYFGLTGARSVTGTASTNSTVLGFRQRPLDDMLVFNTAFGKTVNDISLNARGNLGYSNVRFLEHVYPDDTVSVESKIIGLKENSNGESGIVYAESSANNQYGKSVLKWIRWVMINKKYPRDCSPNLEVPELPASVTSADLSSKPFSAEVRQVSNLTGCPDHWEDYTVGERIAHPLGTTIYQSDHSIATRLYQNNARGHFDSIMMSGKPLVYGGHIISICIAAAYDGFENSVGMLAINAGSHVAPTFPGDTIRCASEVLDKIEMNSANIGGLRIRTIAKKNSAESDDFIFPKMIPGKRAKYGDDVVLDLDYTIAIPKEPWANTISRNWQTVLS